MVGFYKNTEEGWLYAPLGVSSPTYDINLNNLNDLTFPIDGWNFYEAEPIGYNDNNNNTNTPII